MVLRKSQDVLPDTAFDYSMVHTRSKHTDPAGANHTDNRIETISQIATDNSMYINIDLI